MLAAGLKLVVVGQDRSDIPGCMKVDGRRQVDGIKRTHLGRVDPRGLLKPGTGKWSERDQRHELLDRGLHALSSAEPTQLNDQQFARMPRIEPSERRADYATVSLAEHHSAESRRVNVDARHAPLAFAVCR